MTVAQAISQLPIAASIERLVVLPNHDTFKLVRGNGRLNEHAHVAIAAPLAFRLEQRATVEVTVPHDILAPGDPLLGLDLVVEGDAGIRLSAFDGTTPLLVEEMYLAPRPTADALRARVAQGGKAGISSTEYRVRRPLESQLVMRVECASGSTPVDILGIILSCWRPSTWRRAS